MKTASSEAARFAGWVLAEMRQLDERAARLTVAARARSADAQIGVLEEGQFVPLLRLGAASAAYNVMSLFVYQNGRALPTLQRGTPQRLAELLVGPWQHLWLFDVIAQDFTIAQGPPSDQRDPSAQDDPSDQLSGTSGMKY